MRAIEKRRIEQGLCCKCGKVLDREGSLCVSCRDKHSALKKRLYDFRSMTGICVVCGKEEATDGMKACAECRKKENESHNAIRRAYLDVGICPQCRRNRISGNMRACEECRIKAAEIQKNKSMKPGYADYRKNYMRARHEKLKAEGMCTRCAKRAATKGYYTCDYCRQQKKEKHYTEVVLNKKKREGLCRFCGNERMAGYKVCENCRQTLTERARSQNAVRARRALIEEGILY